MVAVQFVRIRVALVMQPVVGVTELVGVHSNSYRIVKEVCANNGLNDNF